MKKSELQGRGVLVVEDNPILATTFEDILVKSGAGVIGPAMTLDAAERLAEDETLSAALLDIWLNGREVWPVARLLERKAVPFVFCTGYYSECLPPEWRCRPVLVKPIGLQTIIDTVANLFECRALGCDRLDM
jgi:CheY-like chemotaxis protein